MHARMLMRFSGSALLGFRIASGNGLWMGVTSVTKRSAPDYHVWLYLYDIAGLRSSLSCCIAWDICRLLPSTLNVDDPHYP